MDLFNVGRYLSLALVGDFDLLNGRVWDLAGVAFGGGGVSISSRAVYVVDDGNMYGDGRGFMYSGLLLFGLWKELCGLAFLVCLGCSCEITKKLRLEFASFF